MTVRVSQSMVSEIDYLAHFSRGLSRSDLIRNYLEEKIEEELENLAEKRAAKRRTLETLAELDEKESKSRR